MSQPASGLGPIPSGVFDHLLEYLKPREFYASVIGVNKEMREHEPLVYNRLVAQLLSIDSDQFSRHEEHCRVTLRGKTPVFQLKPTCNAFETHPCFRKMERIEIVKSAQSIVLRLRKLRKKELSLDLRQLKPAESKRSNQKKINELTFDLSETCRKLSSARSENARLLEIPEEERTAPQIETLSKFSGLKKRLKEQIVNDQVRIAKIQNHSEKEELGRIKQKIEELQTLLTVYLKNVKTKINKGTFFDGKKHVCLMTPGPHGIDGGGENITRMLAIDPRNRRAEFNTKFNRQELKYRLKTNYWDPIGLEADSDSEEENAARGSKKGSPAQAAPQAVVIKHLVVRQSREMLMPQGFRSLANIVPHIRDDRAVARVFGRAVSPDVMLQVERLAGTQDEFPDEVVQALRTLSSPKPMVSPVPAEESELDEEQILEDLATAALKAATSRQQARHRLAFAASPVPYDDESSTDPNAD